MSALRDRIKLLRKEANELEPVADEQERKQGHLAALHEERRGQENRLAVALRLGDRHDWVQDPDAPAGVLRAKSGHEFARDCAARIEAIDAEIARVTETG